MPTSYFNRNTFQGSDALDIIHGKHQIQFGAEYARVQMNEFNLLNANGTVSFNGQFTTNPLVDFLLGDVSSLSQNARDGMAFRQNYVGVYAQDNFQVSRSLNIHVGLRWEPFLPERDTFGRRGYFSQSAFLAGTKTNLYANAPPGLFFNDDPGIPTDLSTASTMTSQVVSASRGIPRGRPPEPPSLLRNLLRPAERLFNAKYADAPPWGNSITLPSPVGELASPYTGYPGGNPFPTPLPPAKNSPFPLSGVYVNLPLNTQPSYVQQWGFSYEFQVAKDWLLSANYIGNKSTHLWARSTPTMAYSFQVIAKQSLFHDCEYQLAAHSQSTKPRQWCILRGYGYLG